MSDENCCGACGYPIHATKDKACDWCRQTADRIEALTEQLEAARADAKEAEAYAEGLEKEIELNEQEACMLEDDFIKADKEIDALKAKLAAAVDWFETIRDRAKGDYMAHTYYLDALAALATIKRREP
jgi:septal ring factor EnvC (AmiA/AmiB activator)